MLARTLVATIVVNAKAFLYTVRSNPISLGAVMSDRIIGTLGNLDSTQILTSPSSADFVVASYNVDGLSDDHANSKIRCCEISRLVCHEAPDVIFFQEVTPQTLLSFSPLLKKFGYSVVSTMDSHSSPYFNVAFSKVNGLCRRLAYNGAATSNMGRDMIIFETIVNGRDVQVISSHLESLADYGAVREAQLEVMLSLMLSFKGPSIVAGDLNIRNKEAEKILRKIVKKFEGKMGDSQLFDCWEKMGRIEVYKNTWVHCDPALKHIQARYDRIYCNGNSATVTGFQLIGKDIMPAPCLTTPSDHYGMIAKFSIKKTDEFTTNSSKESKNEAKSSGSVNGMGIKAAGASISVNPIRKVADESKSLSDISVPPSLSTPVVLKERKRKKSPPATDVPENVGEEAKSRRLVMAAAATKRLLKNVVAGSEDSAPSSGGGQAIDSACGGGNEEAENSIGSKGNDERGKHRVDGTRSPVIIDISNSSPD